MSRTVDERIVSMQFDNKQFETNVKTTMSTIDKLKAKLNFTGATKGLEDISTAANKVDMNGLGKGVEAVQSKFSALEIMGVTALVNISNSAFNAGKKIASALTIDPIKSGFQEYETQMNSVQTILANTQSKGSTLEDVNTALEELNKYADQTIYNFTEMTRNIGTFTAAGVDLDTSVSAIKGIANLAAVSGSTSQQASTAMYQLSQALASGTVRLQDWNSVVNAGMGGEVFQTALKRTATNMGYDVEGMIAQYGSFRESLTRGEWLTTDVLTETLNQFTMAAEEGTEQWEAYKTSLKEQGYTDAQAEEILKMANTATDAATKVKTFTQLWDVLKEAAGSGWAQTWKIIVGDFEEAKALFSPLADFLTGIINGMSDARNAFLETALGTGFGDLLDNINNVTSGVESAVNSIKDYSEVVNNILGGKYGTGEARWKKLAEEGYDWAHAQNLVNEKLGVGKKHATEYAEAQGEVAEAQGEATLADAKAIEMLTMLSDAELRNNGYTEEQIASLRELAKQAEKTGIPLAEFIQNIDKINGRYLLIESFKNVGQSLVKIFTAIGTAWRDAFPPMSGEVLYNIIAAIHKFSLKLKMGEDTAEKLTRTFKGLFAMVDIIATVFGGAFRIGLNIVIKVLETLFKALGFVDLNILDITANIGDSIVAFRDWFESINPITKAIEFIVPLLVKMGKAVVNLFKTVYQSEEVQTAILAVKDAFKSLGEIIDKYFGGAIDTIKEVVKHIKSLDEVSMEDLSKGFSKIGESLGNAFNNIPSDIFSGFVQGLGDGAKKAIDAIGIFCENFIAKAKEVLGIHSPSVIFAAIGAFVILGLINGLQDTASTLWTSIQSIVQNMFDIAGDIIQKGIPFIVDSVKTLGVKLLEALKASDLDLRDIIVGGSIVGALFLFKNFTNVLKAVVSPIENLCDVLDGVGDVLEGFAKRQKAEAWKARSEAIRTMAIAVAILAATLIILGKQDTKELIRGGIALVAVAGALVLVALAAKMFKGDTKGFGKISILLIALAVSVSIMATAMKKLADIDTAGMDQAVNGLITVVGSLATVLAIFGLLVKSGSAPYIDKAGIMILKMAIAIGIIALVIKAMGALTPGQIHQGLGVMLAVEILFGAIIFVSIFAGQYADKAGSMLLKMSIAIGIMVLVIKSMDSLTPGAIMKSIFVLTMVGTLFATMVIISMFAGQHASLAGTMLLKMSAAMLILSGALKILAGIPKEAISKGLNVIAKIGEMFMAFIVVSLIAGDNASKAGSMLLKMSIAIAILAGTIALLTFIDGKALARAFVVIATFEILFATIIAVSLLAGENASKAGSMILKMSAAILILTGCIALLSLLDPADVIRGTACISILLGLFTLLIYVTSLAKPLSKTLTMMAVCIGLLIGGVALLTFLDQDKLINATTCVSVLLGMFALLVASTHFAKGAHKTILLLTVAIVALGGVLYLISGLPIESTRNAAESLAILLLALSASFAIIGATSAMSTSAIPALALMIVATGLLAIILAMMVKMDIQPSIETAGALSILLLSMSAACVILAAVGAVAPMAVAGAAALVGVIGIIGAFIFAIGALQKDMPAMEDFLNRGIGILEKIGYGIGSFLGNIVGGFLSGVTSGLPQIGTDLSMFMLNAMPFIVGAKLIDNSVLTGVKSLAEAILLLTAANVIEGLTSWFTGGNSLADFAEDLPELGTKLGEFATNLGTFDDSTVATVSAATDALVAIAEASDKIPNEGGWLAKLVGDNSISTWGSYLGDLGTNIATFAANLGTFDDATVATVQCACDAITAIAEASTNIPNEGGWLAKIVGDNSISTWGGYLSDLGTNLSDFASNLGTFTPETVATVQCACDAITAIAKASESIPNEGGWLASIVGDNSLGTWGEQLSGLGEDIAGFADGLGDFDESKVQTVNSATKAINALAKLSGVDLSAAATGLTSLGGKLEGFATDLSSFISKMNETDGDSMSAAVNKVKALIELNTKVAETDTKALSTFSDSLSTAAKKGVKGFVDAFKDSTVIEDTKAAIDKLVGTASKQAGLLEHYNKFKESGKYLGDGLINGIKAKEKAVYDAAYALGQEAVKGEKDGQASESPSKLTYQAGIWLGEGLVNGMAAMSKKVYNAGNDLGDRAANSMTSITSRLSDIINSDIDSQPTIRPVLDLSDISNGVDRIGGMLGLNPTIGLATSAGAINASMNARIQNGGNGDIISAIKKLGKDLSNTNNTTTYINGITYDDGSNITNAVKEIVRAAKVERRT